MTTFDVWAAAACLLLLAATAVLSLADRFPKHKPKTLPEWTDDPTAYGDEFWDVVDEELVDVQVTFALVLSGMDQEEENR